MHEALHTTQEFCWFIGEGDYTKPNTLGEGIQAQDIRRGEYNIARGGLGHAATPKHFDWEPSGHAE